MDFDKGWGRIQTTLFWGGLFLSIGVIYLIVDSKGYIPFEDPLFVMSSILFLTPWLGMKIMKWFIDGFRSKEDKTE